MSLTYSASVTDRRGRASGVTWGYGANKPRQERELAVHDHHVVDGW